MTIRLLLCLTLLAVYQLASLGGAAVAQADDFPAIAGGERDGETVVQCADRLQRCLDVHTSPCDSAVGATPNICCRVSTIV